MAKITIVIPVKNPPDLDKFIEGNRKYLKKYPVVIIDSGGGDPLKEFANEYVKTNIPFWEARKLGYSKVKTSYILNLDHDVIIPEGYIEDALELLKKVDAVTIFFEDVNNCQGALEYGISIWKTEILQKLYDFEMVKVFNDAIVQVGPRTWANLYNGWCECTYMWRKLKENNYKLEMLSYRAKHLHVR